MSGRSRTLADETGRDVMLWGVACAPHQLEDESGDLFVVRPSGDTALMAGIDGAGHGAEAAVAARLAAETLQAYAHESPISLVVRCHEHLRSTRGVVMTVASWHFRERTLTWLGVGNVDAVLYHPATPQTAPHRVVLRGGVIGFQLPPLRAEALAIRAHDTLVMVTDGIREDFSEHVVPTGDPQDTAERILADFHKGNDDGLVIVARYLGGADQ